MKLRKRFQKALAITAVATTLASASSAFAIDYTGHWAEPVINEWKEKGVIDGYEDGSFKPKQHVTRAELAKMLVQVFGLTYKEGAENFTDIPENAWYKEHVALVSAAGLMKGTDKNFRPNDPATREEAAYAVAQAYHVVVEKEVKLFKDAADISGWAKESVNALVSGGYINGYPDDTFKPQGQLTRAEMVTMLDKATAEIISKSATYTQDIEGNLVVNGKGVTLKDMTINGNLYIAEGVGESNITLDNVTVTGKIIVEGGGVDTIHIKGKSKFGDIIITKASKKPVRLDIKGTAKVTGTVEVYSPVIIEGTAVSLPKVVVAGPTETVEIKGTVTVEDLAVEGKTQVTLTGTNVVVKGMTIGEKAAETKIKGNGTVDKLTANADKVIIDKNITLDKENITTGTNVTVPPVVETPSGGGGGGGGGGSVTPEEKPFHIESVRVYDGGGYQTIGFENGNDITVTVREDAIVVNNEGFKADESWPGVKEISGVAAFTNIPDGHDVTVSMPGIGSSEVTLKDTEKYDIQDLYNIIQAKKQVASDLIDLFEEQGKFTADQADQARYYLGRMLDIVEESKDQESVPVLSLIIYAHKVEDKIREIGVDKINDKLGAVLEVAGVSITEDSNGEITAKTQVMIKSKGYKDTKINLTAIFK